MKSQAQTGHGKTWDRPAMFFAAIGALGDRQYLGFVEILRQMACKPGSVPMVSHGGRPFIWDARCRDTSRDRPGRLRGSAFRSRWERRPPLFGLAPGGVYRAASVAGRAVRSYRTLSPLPAGNLAVRAGGLLSVALSLGSPPPDVIRHRTSVEPGLSSPEGTLGSGRPAIWRGRQCGPAPGLRQGLLGKRTKEGEIKVFRRVNT
jgi:hypothetical protein